VIQEVILEHPGVRTHRIIGMPAEPQEAGEGDSSGGANAPQTISEAMRRALLTIADLRDATEEMKRRRSSRRALKPEEPGETIP